MVEQISASLPSTVLEDTVLVDRTINQNGDVDNNQMAADQRIIHIESRVDRLETDVSDIKIGVQKLLDRPVLPGFGQIVGTLVSTLVACSIILGFAEWRLNSAFMPVRDEISENKNLNMAQQEVIANLRIKTAVLEERSLWQGGFSTRSNWMDKADKTK